MKQNEVGCLFYNTSRGNSYLCGFEVFNCGERILPYFSLTPSCALPLKREQANLILSRVEFDIRKSLNFGLYPKFVDFETDLFSLEHSPIGGVV